MTRGEEILYGLRTNPPKHLSAKYSCDPVSQAPQSKAPGTYECRALCFYSPPVYSVHMRSILPAEENPVLRGVAKDIPVSTIQSEYIQTLIGEMKTLLAQEEYGVALAAPQVGEPIRLFIVSGHALAKNARASEEEPTEADQVYINPVLVKMSRGKKGKHEGCLSIRGKWGTVKRAEKATVRAYDERGQEFTRGASGFLAHIFQHELDHLEGILYTDKADEVFDDEQKNG